LTHAQELEKQMDALNQSAAGIDDKLKRAQDDFVVRMQVELPRIMDKYVNERRSLVEQKIQQHGVPLPQ
jgi:small-conductance mechanosensitive channel